MSTGETPAPSGESSSSIDPTPEVLKAALKAFKKRLKLTSLDYESRIGASPMTGRAAGIVAVEPPDQYPQAVWDELVKQRKLKRAGGGLYELGQP